MSLNQGNPRDISPLWWVGFPVISLVVYIFALPFRSDLLEFSGGRLGLHGEHGLLENAQVVLLAMAIWIGIALFRLRPVFPTRWIKWWVWLFFFGCLYILGEEISWGQHYFGWATPEWFKAINKQGETNIHNIHSSWLIFKPRLAMELAILVGGIGYPLWREQAARRGSSKALKGSWIWPTNVCFVTAIIVALTSVFRKLEKLLGLELPLYTGVEYGELREYFIYVFLWFYMWSLYMRIRNIGRLNA